MESKKQYVIDRVPFEKLDVTCQKDYGKIWYCHMREYPEICVGGSIGSRRHAKSVCNLFNDLPKMVR